MTQLVKFWMGNISFTSDFTGLSKEEIEKEFIGWLIDKSDAGWEEIIGNDNIGNDNSDDDVIPFDDGSYSDDDYLQELWSE